MQQKRESMQQRKGVSATKKGSQCNKKKESVQQKKGVSATKKGVRWSLFWPFLGLKIKKNISKNNIWPFLL